jgi:hypothetical protein
MPMDDFVSEDDCSLCSKMWQSERSEFREVLDSIPLNRPVCNACLMAFARNIGFPVRDDPVEH